MPSSERPSSARPRRLHFAGAGGSGMSALAQFHAQAGDTVTGSDRAFDDGERAEIRAALERLGVTIVPQDGSFVGAHAEPCDAMVVSTAVEDEVPDVRAARNNGVPILHRSELLAEHVASHRTVAVTGTSGKSTVTAMVFEILRHGGLGPGLLTGGALGSLQADGQLGNAWAPTPPPGRPAFLVVEADESDGSVVRYRPWLGLVLNLGLDHKEPEAILDMFHTFAERTTAHLVVGDTPELAPLAPDAHRFGLGDLRGGTFATDVELTAHQGKFSIEGTEFTVPGPGRFTVLNAVAAIAACRLCGMALDDMVAPVAAFGGVARRFNRLGTAGGVQVIDDFAHNPDKIAAAIAAARLQVGDGGRLLAVFQPHGFGPTRFLRDALVAAFTDTLAGDDILWLPEIFFAGGTVTRDISSADLVADIAARGGQALFIADRRDIPADLAAAARPGDVVLVMGARDPSLPAFGQSLLAALGKEGQP